MDTAAVWHDVECGAYDADLALWEELTAEGGTVLDIGCGTGRVAMYLARRGRAVTGLDRDERLLATLEHRVAQHDFSIETVCADAREFDLGTQFDAVLAPMQFVQLFRGASERREMLERAARHVRPGGVFAATLMDLEGELLGDDYGPPAPDVREVDRWVYSSLSVGVRLVERGRAIRIDRLRTAVSPEGEQSTTADEVRLELVPPDVLEKEVAFVGLEVDGRRTISPTDAHVGSDVVTATKPGAT